jgi:hypothetical protein
MKRRKMKLTNQRNYVEIPLWGRMGKTREVALVSKQDAEEVNTYRWHKHMGKYAAVSNNSNGNTYHTTMHRFILGLDGIDPHKIVHHINGNGLDNRRSNLEIVNARKNSCLTIRASKYGTNIVKLKRSQTFSYCINIPLGRNLEDAVKKGKKIQQLLEDNGYIDRIL